MLFFKKKYTEKIRAEATKELGDKIYEYLRNAYIWRKLELKGHIERNFFIKERIEQFAKEVIEQK